MKNKSVKIVAKILGVLAAGFMMASFSPSLDGRAVVVNAGVFPQGLFAKTVGYLPGDIISVANIAGDSTVDLLVIGALDPSDGIAIMLSPEAAAALGVDKDDNNIVKITKRNGQNERVYGTAVIAKQNAAPETSELDLDIDEEEFDEENAVPDDVAEEDFEDFEEEEVFSDSENEDADEETFEEEEEDFDEDLAAPYEEEEPDDEADDFETIAAEEEAPEEIEETEDEDVENQFADFEEEEADEELDEEVPPAEPVEEVDEQEPAEEEETVAEPVSEESEPVEEEALEEEPLEEELVEEEVPEENWEIVIPDEVWAEEEYAENPLVEQNEELADEIPSDTPYEEEDELDRFINPIIEKYEENFAESEDDEVEDFEDDSDEYAAIVLVPLDTTDSYYEKEADSTEPESEAEENSEPELPGVPYVPAAEDEAVEMTDNGYGKYLVDGLSDLKSGAYYIQIATLSIDENIMEIVNKYSGNYPITIVPLSSGARKQVLIGPLSMDEYAVVLERFKSYGYKDAFLRKIK